MGTPENVGLRSSPSHDARVHCACVIQTCYKDAIATCPGSLVHRCDHMPAAATQASHLAAGFGVLGLRSAAVDRHAAYWASWLDSLPAIQAGSPQIAFHLRRALAAPRARGSIAAAAQAASHLAAQCCHIPAWDASEPPPSAQGNWSPAQKPPARLAAARRSGAFEMQFATLPAASRALLGRTPLAGARSPPRIQLCRRVPSALAAPPRLPLPLASRVCACRGLLDPLGDHRAACANSGALASRALPLERAVARVCREAGARVARNMRLADMNLPVLVASLSSSQHGPSGAKPKALSRGRETSALTTTCHGQCVKILCLPTRSYGNEAQGAKSYKNTK